MNNLGIIPARSGSKGIKDKNIKKLNGKPLIAYTIEAAIKSKMFGEIIVSTDSEEYAKIATEYGANVPFLRSKTFSTDVASSWNVVKEVIFEYQKLGKDFDTVALLQPTSPLRTEDDIILGYEMLKRKEANVVVGVCETDHSPLWANTLPKDCSLTNFINSDILNIPRQELPIYYRINGALYIVKTEYLLTTDNIYSKSAYAVIMDKTHSIDIDDEIDFIVAEAIVKSTI